MQFGKGEIFNEPPRTDIDIADEDNVEFIGNLNKAQLEVGAEIVLGNGKHMEKECKIFAGYFSIQGNLSVPIRKQKKL